MDSGTSKLDWDEMYVELLKDRCELTSKAQYLGTFPQPTPEEVGRAYAKMGREMDRQFFNAVTCTTQEPATLKIDEVPGPLCSWFNGCSV